MSPKQLVLVSGLLTVCSHPIRADYIYLGLKDKYGQSCCSKSGCRPAHFRIGPAGVQMWLGLSWVTIPAEAIIHRALKGDTGETNGGHWCGTHLEDDDLFETYCAVLPPILASPSDASQ